VRVDLSDVPENAYVTCWSPCGRKYYELSFFVEISAQSSLEFFLTIDGKKYGSLSANYE
jgi:hypothetical protein